MQRVFRCTQGRRAFGLAQAPHHYDKMYHSRGMSKRWPMSFFHYRSYDSYFFSQAFAKTFDKFLTTRMGMLVLSTEVTFFRSISLSLLALLCGVSCDCCVPVQFKLGVNQQDQATLFVRGLQYSMQRSDAHRSLSWRLKRWMVRE
ncbi:MAG: hypothetical protein MHM6MM_001599 [Cercozoa sp. M6MM]